MTNLIMLLMDAGYSIRFDPPKDMLDFYRVTLKKQAPKTDTWVESSRSFTKDYVDQEKFLEYLIDVMKNEIAMKILEMKGDE